MDYTNKHLQPAPPCPPVYCICGYGPTFSRDLEAHIVASEQDGSPWYETHGTRRDPK